MRKRGKFAITAFLFFLALFSANAYSQEPPIKWGDIPRADLEMKSYAVDTNASALILCDYGESSFGEDLQIIFTRHLRVKVFTPKGYAFGTVKVGLHVGEVSERLRDIEGITYSLTGNGEVITTKLEKKDIYQEEVVDNYTRYRFTLPALTPGCVFEIRYTINGGSFRWWEMRDWVFQCSEPVRWSEYRMKFPKKVAYNIVKRGYEPFAVSDIDGVTELYSGTLALSYLKGNGMTPCTQYRWAVKDAPAIRDEPFITTVSDYVNKIDVQLSGYIDWSGEVVNVFRTWDKLAEELSKHKNFYRKIDNTRKVKKQTTAITENLTTPREKLIAIYNWISHSIVCTHDAVYADKDGNDVLEEKKGNSSEIAFLFLSMLKCAGIEGYPVILSTRGNGKLQDVYPMISQFNHVLVKTLIDSTSYYLDATEPDCPWDMLPVKVLGSKGLVIMDKRNEWVQLQSLKYFGYDASANISLKNDGSLHGTLAASYCDYAALAKRSKLKEKKDIEVVKEAFNAETTGLIVDSVSISGGDSIGMPLGMKAWVSSQAYTQINGDYIYVNPHIISTMKDNPFTLKNRKFPVDFAHAYSIVTTNSIELPDSFEVKENIKDHEYSVGGNQLTYASRSRVEGRQLKIFTKFNIKEVLIKPGYYEQLKNFYARIVDAESEQLVLSRIHPPVATVPEVKASEATSVTEPFTERKSVSVTKDQKKKSKK